LGEGCLLLTGREGKGMGKGKEGDGRREREVRKGREGEGRKGRGGREGQAIVNWTPPQLRKPGAAPGRGTFDRVK